MLPLPFLGAERNGCLAYRLEPHRSEMSIAYPVHKIQRPEGAQCAFEENCGGGMVGIYFKTFS